MSTQTPKLHLRQFMRDFLAVTRQRGERERTIQERYTASEKAVHEQYAAGERAAAVKYADAIQQQEEAKQRQRSQLHEAATTVDDSVKGARQSLQYLGVHFTGLSLHPSGDSSQQTPVVSTSTSPLAQFITAAKQIQRMYDSTELLHDRWQRQQARRRNTLVGATLLAMMLAVGGYLFYQQWSYDQKVDSLYQAGVAALGNQEWIAARNQFSEVLRLEPGYRDTLALLYDSYYSSAKVAWEAGDWESARTQLSELIARQPEYLNAQDMLHESVYQIGKAALATGDWDTALNWFSGLYAQQSNYKDVQALLYGSYYSSAKTALEAGDWEKARSRFSELLAQQPEYEDAQTLLYESYYRPGRAAFDAGDWKNARADLGELLAQMPEYQDAQTLLYESYYRPGRAALDAGDWKTARTDLGELMAQQPEYKDAQTLLHESYIRPGRAASDAGDWQTALALFTEVLRLQPNNVNVETIVNQYAPDSGFAVNPTDSALYILVPAGEFLMGSPTGQGNSNERPQHTVYLDDYWIMQTEVTNAQYRKCVAVFVCSKPNNSTWRDAAKANHPVTDVDWAQANRYAEWAGGRLPTEAEWEKAARGTDARVYPWGNAEPSVTYANCCNYKNATAPVGNYVLGASPYGVLDMAGNVWEWTADWYDGSYYSLSPAQSPIGAERGEYHVSRGGSAWNEASVVRSAYRVGDHPDVQHGNLGFRVVSSSLAFDASNSDQ